MMRTRFLFVGLTVLVITCGAITGCSNDPAGTDLPVGKPLSQEQLKSEQSKVMEAMKGQYMGAPGAPKPKTQ